MPCFSTIRTKINNADNLGAALAALGWVVQKSNSGRTITGTKGQENITFQRNSTSEAFYAVGDTDYLSAIGRKYAEVGVKSWASRNKFGILDNDGVEMTLVRRTI